MDQAKRQNAADGWSDADYKFKLGNIITIEENKGINQKCWLDTKNASWTARQPASLESTLRVTEPSTRPSKLRVLAPPQVGSAPVPAGFDKTLIERGFSPLFQRG